MLKFSHLRHPLRAANSVSSRVATQWAIWRLASRGRRHFSGDPRYNLRSVSEGFASRKQPASDDRALLLRICRAYLRARDEHLENEHYGATEWWQEVQRGSLAPVRRALENQDIASLQAMYQNFYRDTCSNGLIGLNLNIAKASLCGSISEIQNHFLLSDALYRIDYWKVQTANRFDIAHLAGPDVGNPFGVMIDDSLVRTGAEYQHYCANRIRELIPSSQARVLEIGGGFGGMAYYLLRGCPNFTYIDVDVPESIALTSYYLLKCFPDRKILLYGEEDLKETSTAQFDVILMPSFVLPSLPAKSVDVTFSSHTLSDLSPSAQSIYLNDILRATKSYFLNVGVSSDPGRLNPPSCFELAEQRVLGWNHHRSRRLDELESVYRICNHAERSL